MNNRNALCSAQAQPNRNLQTGFSIVELMITCVILFTIMAMAVMQLRPAWQQMQANAAMAQVKTTLRQARETAISERRTIVVQFPAASTGTSCLPKGNVSYCITLTVMNVVPGVAPAPPTEVIAANPFLTIPLEDNVTFISYVGEPDTPDGFIGTPPVAPNGLYAGSTSGVPVSGLQFQSDGTFTNGNVTPVNLTLFLGEANIPTTARAITILGNTGRVQSYQGSGKGWVQ